MNQDVTQDHIIWRLWWGWRIFSQDGSSHGYWKELWFLTMWASPQGWCNVLLTWWLGFPQVSDPSDRKVEVQCLYDPALEVTCSYFHSILLVAQINTVQCEKGLHRTMNSSKEEPLGVILEAGCHRAALSCILGLPRWRKKEEVPLRQTQSIIWNVDTLFSLRRRKGHLQGQEKEAYHCSKWALKACEQQWVNNFRRWSSYLTLWCHRIYPVSGQQLSAQQPWPTWCHADLLNGWHHAE